MQNFAFKFQTVAEKTAKIVRGLLYFAAPCRLYGDVWFILKSFRDLSLSLSLSHLSADDNNASYLVLFMSGLRAEVAEGVDTRVGLPSTLFGDTTWPASELGKYIGSRMVISGLGAGVP